MKVINSQLFYRIFPALFIMIIINPCLYSFDIVYGGYLKNMQSALFIEHDDDWALGNIWNLRLNARVYFSDDLSFVLGGNTMFIYSNYLDLYSDEQKGSYSNFEERDISFGYISNSYLLRTFIDRSYLEYLGNKYTAYIGYQRINWGMNLSWNPNDIFNAYSLYDFDYEERPGILSLRGIYYTSIHTFYDIVISADDIYGALYRTNIKGFDIQFLGGYGNDNIILGSGFAGQVMKGGLRSEFTAFIEDDDNIEYIGAITGDYTFKNGLYLHLGLLYNSYGLKENALLNKIYPKYDNPVKNLSAGRYSAMLEASYNFSPLLTGSITAVTNLLDNSFFISPMIIYSIFEDFEFLILSQLNLGNDLDEYSKDLGKAFFARLRYSF